MEPLPIQATFTILRNNELRAYIHVLESGYEVVMSLCQHGDDLMSQVRTVISVEGVENVLKILNLELVS